MDMGRLAGEIGRDLRHGARQLRLNPGFSAVAICTLALGIGANSAAFTVVNSILLRPLVAAEPDRLVAVFDRSTALADSYRSLSYPNYRDLRSSAVFSDLLAHELTEVGVTEGDATRRVPADFVSANYLATLGVEPWRGRGFLPAEEAPGSAAPVVIVSHRHWERGGRDPDLVGKTLRVNGQPLTIVGIAPAGFTGTTAILASELYLPFGARDLLMRSSTAGSFGSIEDRAFHRLLLVGRLRAGIDTSVAGDELAALASRMAEADPAVNRDHTFVVGPLSRISTINAPTPDTWLAGIAAAVMAMTGIVLLIACINLGGMLMARGAARREEFAIRCPIGGGRGRIVQQLLTEGMLLSVAGAGVGLLLAYGATRSLGNAIRQMLSLNALALDVQLTAVPDTRVLLATAGFCLLSTVLFATGPAWSLARQDLTARLKGHARGGEPGRSRVFGASSPLVVGQIALSLVLLAAAALFLRGASNAAHVDTGFPVHDALLARIDPGLLGTSEADARELYARLLARLDSTPGVAAASVAATVPFGAESDRRSFRRAEDIPAPGADDRDIEVASPPTT